MSTCRQFTSPACVAQHGTELSLLMLLSSSKLCWILRGELRWQDVAQQLPLSATALVRRGVSSSACCGPCAQRLQAEINSAAMCGLLLSALLYPHSRVIDQTSADCMVYGTCSSRLQLSSPPARDSQVPWSSSTSSTSKATIAATLACMVGNSAVWVDLQEVLAAAFG